MMGRCVGWQVILGPDGETRDAWIEEHFDRLEDFRAQRLPEVKGFMVTTGIPDSAGRRPTGIMKMGPSRVDPARQVGVFDPSFVAGLPALRTAELEKFRDDHVVFGDVYLRFHGTRQWYRHDYGRAELVTWVGRVRASGAARVWAYFNNDRDGHAIRNARELLRQLKSTATGA